MEAVLEKELEVSTEIPVGKDFWYEVRALGYTEDNWYTDIEKLLGIFTDKQEAVYFAERFSAIEDVFTKEELETLEKGDYMEIRVEKIIVRGNRTIVGEVVFSEYIY